MNEVQSFLGCANYYRRFIKDYSRIMGPLYALTRADTELKWMSACQNALDTLKDKLISDPIVKHPYFNEPFILYTDACRTGVAYILSQKQDGKEVVIEYGSRSRWQARRGSSITTTTWQTSHSRSLPITVP